MGDHSDLYWTLKKNNYKIDKTLIKKIADQFKIETTDHEIKEIFEAADFDRDGEIGQKDFEEVLNRTNFY